MCGTVADNLRVTEMSGVYVVLGHHFIEASGECELWCPEAIVNTWGLHFYSWFKFSIMELYFGGRVGLLVGEPLRIAVEVLHRGL